MRKLSVLAVLLAGGAYATGAGATRDETIRKLASEEYTERVEATQALWAEGENALDALKEAARSSDPEMALRARDLLRKIDLGIAPDTDPRIIDLTDRYRTADQNQKSTIFHELRQLRAWRQILRLYANETDASTRGNLERMVDGIALHAARDRIASGDQEGALEYLEMARSTPGGLISIAAFHRAQGTIQEEIEAVGDPAGPDELAWLTALHRVADDAERAAITARTAGNDSLAAAMDMLLGNPLPWLKHAEMTAAEQHDVTAATYARAAAARWRGDSAIPELESIRRQLRSHDESTRLRGVAQLFLLGETEAAWKSFTHHSPENAFKLFDALERVDDALATLGLDPENPDFAAYLTPLLDRVCQPPGKPMDEEEDRDAHVQKLITICNFLEKRGRHDTLDQLVVPSLVEFGAVHPPRFTDLISELFAMTATYTRASDLAMRVAARWAGDDDKRWNEMMIAAFGEEQGYPEWWRLLEKIDPKSTHSERLRGMLALFGYTRDAENLHDRWLDATWRYIESAEDPGPAIESLEFLAANIADIALVEKLSVVNAANADIEDAEFGYSNLLVDTAAGRWGDVADMFLTQIAALAERGDARAELHAYASASLRKAGRIEEADAHESWVEALALGDFRANVSIAQAYGFGRDYERASRWYRRAVMESDPNDNRFKQVLPIYINELLHQRKFALIAACSEVQAHLHAAESDFDLAPNEFTQIRQQADFAHALALPAEQSDDARNLLRKAHAVMPTHGALADHFFPSLLESSFTDLHDELFEISWQKITASLENFPDADNTMNTAVWFASRSARRLEEAKKLQQRALELHPRSPAYLDTMAEVYFAMGNRPEAVRFGALALRYMPHDSMIIRQYERFLHGAMPVR